MDEQERLRNFQEFGFDQQGADYFRNQRGIEGPAGSMMRFGIGGFFFVIRLVLSLVEQVLFVGAAAPIVLVAIKIISDPSKSPLGFLVLGMAFLLIVLPFYIICWAGQRFIDTTIKQSFLYYDLFSFARAYKVFATILGYAVGTAFTYFVFVMHKPASPPFSELTDSVILATSALFFITDTVLDKALEAAKKAILA